MNLFKKVVPILLSGLLVACSSGGSGGGGSSNNNGGSSVPDMPITPSSGSSVPIVPLGPSTPPVPPGTIALAAINDSSFICYGSVCQITKLTWAIASNAKYATSIQYVIYATNSPDTTVASGTVNTHGGSAGVLLTRSLQNLSDQSYTVRMTSYGLGSSGSVSLGTSTGVING